MAEAQMIRNKHCTNCRGIVCADCRFLRREEKTIVSCFNSSALCAFGGNCIIIKNRLRWKNVSLREWYVYSLEQRGDMIKFRAAKIGSPSFTREISIRQTNLTDSNIYRGMRRKHNVFITMILKNMDLYPVWTVIVQFLHCLK